MLERLAWSEDNEDESKEASQPNANKSLEKLPGCVRQSQRPTQQRRVNTSPNGRTEVVAVQAHVLLVVLFNATLLLNLLGHEHCTAHHRVARGWLLGQQKHSVGWFVWGGNAGAKPLKVQR